MEEGERREYIDWLRKKGKLNLRYGNEAPSRFVPAEKGRGNIFVMSEGALEQEEVDDLVEAARYKEDERLKKGRRISRTKSRIQKLMDIAYSEPEGQRGRAIDESIQEV